MKLIEAEHLSFIYAKGTAEERPVLKDISLSISTGEFIGLIGRSGSGKTTLIKHFNGLLRASSGRLFYRGQDVSARGFRMTELRRHVGLVFQYPEHQLFRKTVLDDVAFGPENMGDSREEARTAAAEAMEIVGLGPAFQDKAPLELSGGEMRRVAIAGVLAMCPEVLILDEPTAGLDPSAKRNLFTLLDTIRKERGTAILMVSHSMEDIADNAGRVLVLEKGTLLCDGTPSEVFQQVSRMEETGTGVPQITSASEILRREGVAMERLPISVEEAVGMFAKLLQGGKS